MEEHTVALAAFAFDAPLEVEGGENRGVETRLLEWGTEPEDSGKADLVTTGCDLFMFGSPKWSISDKLRL